MEIKQVCKCGRGYVSAYDGKCGHCRTPKERSRHAWFLRHGIYEKMAAKEIWQIIFVPPKNNT